MKYNRNRSQLGYVETNEYATIAFFDGTSWTLNNLGRAKLWFINPNKHSDYEHH